MKKKHLVTALWVLTPIATFGLGWMLKPNTGSLASGKTANPDSSTLPPRPISALPGTKDQAKGANKNGPADDSNALALKRVLTPEDIEALGEKFKGTLDPIERRLAFSELLKGLTAENAEKIREQIEHLRADSPEFREFHYAWGQIDGPKAVMFGADTDKADMSPAISGWASNDPAAAMDWFNGLDMENDPAYDSLLKDRGLDPEKLRTHFAEGLVRGLANTDPEMATEFVFSWHEAGHERSVDMLGIVTGSIVRAVGAADAAAWAANLPVDDPFGENVSPLRQSAIARVAGHFAGEDPIAAAAWATELDVADQSGRVIYSIANKLGAQAGADAVEWAAGLDAESPGRQYAMHSAFEGWAHSNPSDASEYLSSMPASPDRDKAIGGFISRHRWENPEAAILWANEIADTGTREGALVKAGRAYVRTDPNGAATWLEGSGLSPEAQSEVLNPPRDHGRDRRK